MPGAHERRVELLHDLGDARVLRADDHAVGLHEVLDGGALLHELRVAHHIERMIGRGVDHLRHLLRGADRDGRLVDDDAIAVHRAADLRGGVEDVAHVRRTVLARRSSHGDEHDQAVADRVGDVGREVEPALVQVAAHELVEPGLVDRDLPVLQEPDLLRVEVGADDVVACFRETSAHDEADITGPDDRDLHGGGSGVGAGFSRSRGTRATQAIDPVFRLSTRQS
jgi:hypothetical protein